MVAEEGFFSMDEAPDEFYRPQFYETLGIEITEIDDGRAEGRLEVDESLSAIPGGGSVAHGGVIASLADSVAYWAASSANDFTLTPTVDLRVDYLAPASGELHATAETRRNGDSVGTVDCEIEGEEGLVATARGVFKTGGSGDASTWTDTE